MPNDNYANKPNQSRSEDIIQSILDNTEYDEEARSRIEYLLIELKNAIEGGGGGGSVTSYLPLTEKPKIDNHTLQAGNNTSSDLGLQTKLTFDSAPTESSTNPVTSGGVYTALAAKANSTDVYNKSAIDTVLNTKADKSTTYAKSEVDTALSSKQNTISDLTTIRSGAALGATAVQPVSGKGLSSNDYTTAEKTKLAGIAEGAEVNVQSNWAQSSTTADDYIKNKPTLGTASALDVAASGNASTSQVVKGNDTRLTDARNAADVSSWAKEANKPSYNGSEIALSGYAEAQSKSNVAATDTTNAAIGKLEYRVETNENNISIIDILSTVTPASGYTIDSKSTLYKQGKHVFGNLIIQKSTAYSTTQYTAAKLTYKPAKSYLGGAFLSPDWGVTDIGYVYIHPTSGELKLQANPAYSGSDTYMYVPLDFVTA